MKKIIAGAVAALMAISLAPAGFAAVNEAVTNGSIGMKWQVTSSGSVTEDQASFVLADDKAYSQPYSLKLTHDTKTEAENLIGIKIPVTLEANEKYKICFKSNVAMGNNSISQYIYFGNVLGWSKGCRQYSGIKPADGEKAEKIGTVDEMDWYQNEFYYTAQGNVLYLSFSTKANAFPAGAKYRYFDDFEIYKVTTDESGSEVLTPLEIPDADFNFKNPSVKNITAAKNVISWEETESYDTLNVYEKTAAGVFSKVAEVAYPETECTVEVPQDVKTYYITTVTDGAETIDVPVTVFPDKQISAITLKNSSGETIESLESGTLTAEISIENNSVEEGIGAQLITVLYKDDVVVAAAATAAQTIAPNGATVDPTVLSLPVTVDLTDEGVYRLEVYVWDSFAAMNVVADALVVNEPAE